MSVEEIIRQKQAEVEAAAATRAKRRAMRFDTIAVHGVYDMQEALRNQGSINEPLYLSSAEHYPDSDTMEAAVTRQIPNWTYTRIHNPTLHYLEQTLALMEGYGVDADVSAFVTASGMAAVYMATYPFLVPDGSLPMNIVANARCYGGTFTLFTERYVKERGIEVRWVRDPLNVDEWASHIDSNTRFVYSEMPSNPSLTVTPIREVSDLAHTHGIPFLIDSTLATPALMRPIQHGADVVIHSVSKSMTISGLAIAGAVVARHDLPSRVLSDAMRANFAEETKRLPTRDFGPGLSPFNALMVINDLRTLRSRMDKLSRNAQVVAEFLDSHPKVEQVFYPGLEHHEGHTTAKDYMWLVDGEDEYGKSVNRYGHLIGFTVKGGIPAARQAMDGLELVWRATDLGRIKSIATIPSISTHQQQGESGRQLAQVPEHLIRLNVGGEHPHDVIDDLDQALGQV